MSVASAQAAMRQLVTVERDTAEPAPSSDWTTAPTEPNWQPHLTGLQCFAWSGAGREATDATTVVVVEDLRAIVPLGTDVTERDRLGDITDSNGNVLIPGPTGIRTVLYERDYIELVLVKLDS